MVKRASRPAIEYVKCSAWATLWIEEILSWASVGPVDAMLYVFCRVLREGIKERSERVRERTRRKKKSSSGFRNVSLVADDRNRLA